MTMTAAQGEPKVSTQPRREVDDSTYRRILTFMYDEADLFDAHRYQDWLQQMVSEDIRYDMPVRQFHEGGVTRQRPRQNGYFADDYHSLLARVTLWSKPGSTTAENPPTFTRHFVTNVRAFEGEGAGSYGGASHVLVFRVRPTEPAPHLFSGRRSDTLSEIDGQLRLASRFIEMDEHVLMAANLSYLI